MWGAGRVDDYGGEGRAVGGLNRIELGIWGWGQEGDMIADKLLVYVRMKRLNITKGKSKPNSGAGPGERRLSELGCCSVELLATGS